MNDVSDIERHLDEMNEKFRVAQFTDAGLPVPEHGKKYLCKTIHGSCRVLRYGYHRKNNPNNWRKPPLGMRTNTHWVGWRDDENWRFIRFEEVVEINEHP